MLRKLVAGGFIRTAEPTPNEGFDYFFSSPPSASEPTGEAKRRAAQEAASGAAALRQNGYYVSIARRAKATTQAARRLTVLVIEDEPLVAKFLKIVVETEGHVVRMAANREAIVAQLRQAPLPDIVILDLMLPDTSGFDVLQRMKSHRRSPSSGGDRDWTGDPQSVVNGPHSAPTLPRSRSRSMFS